MVSGRAPRADVKEVAMYPALITAAAAERRRDQIAQATAARRARQARRARRAAGQAGLARQAGLAGQAGRQAGLANVAARPPVRSAGPATASPAACHS